MEKIRIETTKTVGGNFGIAFMSGEKLIRHLNAELSEADASNIAEYSNAVINFVEREKIALPLDNVPLVVQVDEKYFCTLSISDDDGEIFFPSKAFGKSEIAEFGVAVLKSALDYLEGDDGVPFY